MKIIKIEIRKLFGMFDYNIPFDNDNITIIHGENGLGKTTILTMIDAVFNNNFDKFFNIPFENFIINFDDNQALEIQRQDDNCIVFKQNEKKFPYKKNHRKIARNSSFIERIGENKYIDIRTRRILTKEEYYERFMPLKSETPEWFDKIKDIIKVKFIKTDRIHTLSDSKIFEDANIYTIVDYSEKLSKTIEKKHSEYGVKTTELERTFPERLIKNNIQYESDKKKLKEQLSDIDNRFSSLSKLGILDQEPISKAFHIEDVEKINDSDIKTLSMYISDTNEKLKVFDGLIEKINIFTEIINKKFRNKTLSIKREKGFVFTTDMGRELNLTQLSSGEQHEIILLYDLLFNIAADSLVLIDEPEISLHISWQDEFINDMIRISKISRFNSIIATHSPQIIGDKWDLTFELEGK